MSPEYAIHGKFSVKSDVFSFGVLLMEIMSGKKNSKYRHPDHPHSLLGHVSMSNKMLTSPSPTPSHVCVWARIMYAYISIGTSHVNSYISIVFL